MNEEKQSESFRILFNGKFGCLRVILSIQQWNQFNLHVPIFYSVNAYKEVSIYLYDGLVIVLDQKNPNESNPAELFFYTYFLFGISKENQ